MIRERAIEVMARAIRAEKAKVDSTSDDMATAAYDALVAAKPFPMIEFHQWDWFPGFAAFVDDGQKFNHESKAFCVLNLGAVIAAVETKDLPIDEIPYVIADSMMHEITHVIEKWAGVEFSENRVEALRDKYRAMIGKAE